MQVNNCVRVLKTKNIKFQVYTLSNEKRSALEVAQLLNVDPFIVYKTIVITRSSKKKPILAVIPGPLQVDLRKVASSTGEKKVYFPSIQEAEKLTGYKTGGISPLILSIQGFQVILDKLSEEHSELIISGGERGLHIRLAVSDFIFITSALIAPIT